MPTVQLSFPAGRYHATPWGHHVNEGMVEWPPSPWRLLRAFISCGYTKLGWTDVPAPARRLIEALAAVLPSYLVPPAVHAHSRHYMPLGAQSGKTALVLDAWADVGSGSVVVHWPCEIDNEAQEVLDQLLGALHYLGRSESWVIAERVSPGHHAGRATEIYPHVDGHRADRGWEQVSVLAPDPPMSYAAWREQAVAAAIAGLDKQTKAKRSKAAEPYPADLVEALQSETSWWRKHRWSQPPGSRRVLYWRRADALAVGVPQDRHRSDSPPVTTMLLALTTGTGSRSALPKLTRTLPQAELLHRALVSRASGGDARPCPELTGRSDIGTPLIGHQHAHLLAVDLDSDGRLDHILVHCPMGLGGTAQAALRGLKRTWTKGGVGDLRVAMAGQGDVDDLRGLPEPLAASVERLLGTRGGSRTWVSSTPFVAPRYVKQRGANTLAGQVQAELASRGLPPAATVEVLPWNGERLALRHFVRVRRHPAPRPPADTGFALRLEFAEPVGGPLTLGYGAHFGLGLFSATL